MKKIQLKKDGEIVKVSQDVGIEDISDSPIYFKDYENQ